MAVRERLSLRNAYMYLVCLITLVISIFSAVSLVRNVVELIYPDPGAYGYEFAPREAGVTDEERDRQVQAQKDSQRRNTVIGVVGATTTLVISVPVYAYHWRRIQAELPRGEVAGAE
jgi:hypothetical protein